MLAKKYFEKKNKKSSQLSVGDTPAMTPGSLERCPTPNPTLLAHPVLTMEFTTLQCLLNYMDYPAHHSRVPR